MAARTLIFRADANRRIGTGHLMRCLALAHAWQAAGGRAVFVSCCPVKSLRDRIEHSGADLIDLESPWPDPRDPAVTCDLLTDGQAAAGTSRAARPWVVLDGYHLDADYQRRIRTVGGRLLVIDDMGHLPRYHADLLLNQNPSAEHIDYLCDPEPIWLSGPRYALLRPEFQQRNACGPEPPKTARKLLVAAGGADPENVTSTLMRALGKMDVPGLQARVVVGAANPHGDALHAQLPGAAGRIRLLVDVPDLSALMAWADVAVSAAGGTVWELARMQVPAAVFVLADNQERIARRLADADVVTGLGRFDQLTPQQVAQKLTALCRDPIRRASQIEAGRRLVDGQGAWRVAAVIRAWDGPLPDDRLGLRPVAADDVWQLWRLANDPAVRRVSLVSQARIPRREHQAWFEARLASRDTRIWVLDFQGLILGVIRYERTGSDAADISIHVASAFRRRGLATRLLNETQRLAASELGAACFRAVVRRENHPSARTFAKAGYASVDARPINGQPCLVFERMVSAEVLGPREDRPLPCSKEGLAREA
ncbi:MAG: UDP-2,4-diacetamido-2,4,6-trideoxy-beta-L-altropyranose hydrolase [Pirellulales bacterium]|nr:UDP-2,4-diacetamido-2,4,6-trideoxy-beta-L-altropyranose hydrolase [Pirellulales bacterium]